MRLSSLFVGPNVLESASPESFARQADKFFLGKFGRLPSLFNVNKPAEELMEDELEQDVGGD